MKTEQNTVASEGKISGLFSLRFVALFLFLLASLLLFAYTLYFFHHFQTYGIVTSRFPWRWDIVYTRSYSVLDNFVAGLGVSIIIAGLSSILLFRSYRAMGSSSSSIKSAPQAHLSPEASAYPASKDEQMKKTLDSTTNSSERTNEDQIESLRRDIGRRSRFGGVFFIALSILFLAISYKYPNYIVEVDSIVAFIAALVLLYKDRGQFVQLRVANRILNSSEDLIDALAESVSSDLTFRYVPKGPRISDVSLIGCTEQPKAAEKREETSGDAETILKKVKGGRQIDERNFVPVGRGLAQLFVREMGSRNSDLDSFINLFPSFFSENFGLSRSVNVTKIDDVHVEFSIMHPALANSHLSSESEHRFGCITCSLIATLVCFITGREITVRDCSYDFKHDISIVKLELGAVREHGVING